MKHMFIYMAKNLNFFILVYIIYIIGSCIYNHKSPSLNLQLNLHGIYIYYLQSFLLFTFLVEFIIAIYIC